MGLISTGVKQLLLLLALCGCYNSSLAVSFYLLADPQFDNGRSDNQLTRQVMAHAGIAARSNNTSVFVLGDLTQNGRQDEMRWYAKSRSNKISSDENDDNRNYFIEIPGNHDYDDGGWSNRTAWNGCIDSLRRNFRCAEYSTKRPDMYNYYFSSYKNRSNKIDFKNNPSFFNQDSPAFFLFQKQGVTVASLGNLPHFGQRGGCLDNGGVSYCQDGILNALIEALKHGGFDRQAPMILLMHQGFYGQNYQQLSSHHQRLVEFINQHNVIALFAGHQHDFKQLNLSSQYGIRNMFNRQVNQYRLPSARDSHSYYRVDINVVKSSLDLYEYQPLSEAPSNRHVTESSALNSDHYCTYISANVWLLSRLDCQSLHGNSLQNIAVRNTLMMQHPLLTGFILFSEKNGKGDHCQVNGDFFNGQCQGQDWRGRTQSVQFLFSHDLPAAVFCAYPNSSFYNIPKCRPLHNRQQLNSLAQLYSLGSFKLNHPMISQADIYRDRQYQQQHCQLNSSEENGIEGIYFDGHCQQNDWRWRVNSLKLQFDDSQIVDNYYCSYPHSSYGGEPSCFPLIDGFFKQARFSHPPGSLRFSSRYSHGFYLFIDPEPGFNRCLVSSGDFNGYCSRQDWRWRAHSMQLLQTGTTIYVHNGNYQLCLANSGTYLNMGRTQVRLAYCDPATESLYRQWRYDPATYRIQQASDPEKCLEYVPADNNSLSINLTLAYCSDSETQRFNFADGEISTRALPRYYLNYTPAKQASMWHLPGSVDWQFYQH